MTLDPFHVNLCPTSRISRDSFQLVMNIWLRAHVKWLNVGQTFRRFNTDTLGIFSLSFVMVCLLGWLIKKKFLSPQQEPGLEISGEVEISTKEISTAH